MELSLSAETGESNVLKVLGDLSFCYLSIYDEGTHECGFKLPNKISFYTVRAMVI